MFAWLRSNAVSWTFIGSLATVVACTPPPKDEGDAQEATTSSSSSGGAGGNTTMQEEVPVDPAAPFALIELFTSEGCSSCPPADDAVGSVLEAHDGPGERVFAIEWHVDYWDYLGHLDPYSSSIFTDRQQAYARAANSTQLFTPQLLVNTANTTPVVSNVEAAVGAAMNDAVAVSTTLWLDASYPGPGLVLNYKVLDAPPNAQLHVVVVEGGIANAVYSGENAGLTLHHSAAARWYYAFPVGEGAVHMELPQDVVLENSSIIGLVQTSGDMALHGATRIAATSAP